MATGLVLRAVLLLCGDQPPAVRGQAPRWIEKTGSELNSDSFHFTLRAPSFSIAWLAMSPSWVS